MFRWLCPGGVNPSTSLFIAAAVSIAAHSARAQGREIISGIVTDSSDAPVWAAEVRASTSPYPATTDERGLFSLAGVPPGSTTIVVRRLGFAPSTLTVILQEGKEAGRNLHIRLGQLSADLKPVVVSAKTVDYTGRLAGYYQRLEKRNGGYFITRAQIDRENTRTLSQLLTHAPAVRAIRGRAGLQGVRMRGRNCWPLIWLDGTPMPAGEVDLDAIAPQSLQGIELYLGSTSAPARFTLSRDVNSCGTIVLWSRGPDTDPILPRVRPAEEVQALLEAVKVYTANQVDTTAQLRSQTFAVVYPPSLFAEGVSGSVMAEFVVDSAGNVEPGTFGIVVSTDPLFTEAVRAAVEAASFWPARRNGRSVRQVVQQPFSFLARLRKNAPDPGSVPRPR